VRQWVLSECLFILISSSAGSKILYPFPLVMGQKVFSQFLSAISAVYLTSSNSRIASQFASYKADRFAILPVPGLNPAPAKSFSRHL